MSRSLAFELSAESLALGYLVTITRRDGVVQRFTTAQADVTIGTETWNAVPGVELSKIECRSDGSVANAEIKIATRSSGLVNPNDVKQRKYNGADIKIYLASLL